MASVMETMLGATRRGPRAAAHAARLTRTCAYDVVPRLTRMFGVVVVRARMAELAATTRPELIPYL